eukprot:CAMPEP_0179448392 /NCGR_PEP_ID=MMETSP0799-20121207/32234_1 /TAXON_ID=46947 /ORGANISM="Geminigera cryophila, Strain CCMP2564" /LENGTH=73 /DNA_ID=CAMNT_0021240181 /DNA_START=35 /DNA_END=256 /DNA_ORIENTATION=+
MYPGDNIASMYATSMHSGSGYLVTSPDGSASYGGYLTWDDHPKLAQKPKAKAAKVIAKTLGGCKPFGCVAGLE